MRLDTKEMANRLQRAYLVMPGGRSIWRVRTCLSRYGVNGIECWKGMGGGKEKTGRRVKMAIVIMRGEKSMMKAPRHPKLSNWLAFRHRDHTTNHRSV